MNRELWKKFIEELYPNKKDRKIVNYHIRLALTGQTIGPDLYSIMEILGFEKVKTRFLNYYDKIKNL